MGTTLPETGYVALKVTGACEIDRLNGLIHDEFFDLSDLQHDVSTGVLDLPYSRLFHGDPGRVIRNWFFYKVYEVDVRRALLRIFNVKGFGVEDRSRLGTYSFNRVAYDERNGLISIVANEDLEIVARVDSLSVESRDIETRGKGHISRLFGFIESFWARVYE